MQNKPNVKYTQINVNSYIKGKYEISDNWCNQKNKPNSNPIKPNFKRAKMNVSLYVIEDYRKKDDFVVRINKPNLVRRRRIPKMHANVFITKDYENETAFRPKKTNPNKPNSNPIQTQSKPVKFLNLWSASVTIIRKSVIRQVKRVRLDWLLLGTVIKIILEHSPVGAGLNLELVLGDRLPCQRNSLRKR